MTAYDASSAAAAVRRSASEGHVGRLDGNGGQSGGSVATAVAVAGSPPSLQESLELMTREVLERESRER